METVIAFIAQQTAILETLEARNSEAGENSTASLRESVRTQRAIVETLETLRGQMAPAAA